MLNRYEENRSAYGLALRVVPYLSHGTFWSLEIWLRGLATNIICSSGDQQRETVLCQSSSRLRRLASRQRTLHLKPNDEVDPRGPRQGRMEMNVVDAVERFTGKA